MATDNVPPKVMAPLVAVDGVRPVVPALNVVTESELIVDVVTSVDELGMVVLFIVPAVVLPDNVAVVIVGEVENTMLLEPVELVEFQVDPL